MNLVISLATGILGGIFWGFMGVLASAVIFQDPITIQQFLVVGGIGGGLCFFVMLFWQHRHKRDMLLIHVGGGRVCAWRVVGEDRYTYFLELDGRSMKLGKLCADIRGRVCRCEIYTNTPCPDSARLAADRADCGCWYHAEQGIPCPHDTMIK